MILFYSRRDGGYPGVFRQELFTVQSDFTMNQKQRGLFKVTLRFADEGLWVIGNAIGKWPDYRQGVSGAYLSHGGGNLDIHGTRSATAGRVIAREVRSWITDETFQPIQLQANEKSEVVVTLEKSVPIESLQGAMSVIRIENKLETARFFDQFRVSGGSTTPIQMTFENTDDSYRMTVKGLDENSGKKIIDQLKSNPSLRQSFEALLSVNSTVSVTAIPRSEEGSFRIESLSFAY